MSDQPELLASDDTESLDPELVQRLSETLSSAWDPAAISPERHEALLQSCLEDPFAEPTPEELIESERLRDALESGDASHTEAALARALKAAVQPHAPSRAQLERVATEVAPKRNVIYVAFGGAALLAAAAAVLLLVTTQGTYRVPQSGPQALTPSAPLDALAESRTTTTLFNEPFEPGETTSRVDRILATREKELRHNRYARWGVR